ncbi:G patch domain-containing protein 11 [Neolecta irregularis DAH-3]|uniref:G patch domain-containing protein 11 n=1 Tax=Neolecta irregularis (strain DAH-3) TaxID=1198029 RepID=A0A1U7LVJ3_NEOID|nr:G patch domain-containing protein 11 [Neolecta irregularis DAH-3]|eukprot:OLL26677.1 G patch domain-containing protein 11 [Neolecta irregularis DAH-3]
MSGNIENDLDDYMTMTLPDVGPKIDSYVKKRTRKLNEQHERSKTRAPLKVAEEKRIEGLKTSILVEQNKGMKMMKLMGYSQGGLGKNQGRTEPVSLTFKEDRTGIGHSTTVKRKLEEAVEEETKRQQTEKMTYQERVRLFHDEKKYEGQMYACQRICELLEGDEAESKPLRSINVVWRGFLVERQTAEREKLIRKQITDRTETISHSIGPDDYKRKDAVIEEEDEEDGPDEELEEFNSLKVYNSMLGTATDCESIEKLDRLLKYLRDKHAYCFWCGCAYDNQEDLEENCPGIHEEDH